MVTQNLIKKKKEVKNKFNQRLTEYLSFKVRLKVEKIYLSYRIVALIK